VNEERNSRAEEVHAKNDLDPRLLNFGETLHSLTAGTTLCIHFGPVVYVVSPIAPLPTTVLRRSSVSV